MEKRKQQVIDGENWQLTKRTALSRLSYMLDKQILTDIHFIIGQEAKEHMSAHKLILSISSPVFFTMFNGSVQLTENRVTLPDIEPQAFRSLLKYVYSDIVDLDASSVMATLYAAKKYELPGLEEACEKFLVEKVSSENVFSLLTQANFFDRPKLVDLCLRKIDSDAQQSFQQKGFLDIDLESLCQVLSRDTLFIHEKELFGHVVRWAVEQCKRQGLEKTPKNQRNVLKRALYLIRFPVMTPEEFSKGPARSGLLLEGEIIDVFMQLSLKETATVVFPANPRHSGDVKLKRFSTVCSRQNLYGEECASSSFLETMSFMVDREITLKSFGIYGSASTNSAKYKTSISIVASNEVSPETASVSYTSIDSTMISPFVFHAVFPNPINVHPGVWYKVSTHVDGPYDTFTGVNGPTSITAGTPTNGVKFVFSSSTCYSCGVVAEMIFSIIA